MLVLLKVLTMELLHFPSEPFGAVVNRDYGTCCQCTVHLNASGTVSAVSVQAERRCLASALEHSAQEVHHLQGKLSCVQDAKKLLRQELHTLEDKRAKEEETNKSTQDR